MVQDNPMRDVRKLRENQEGFSYLSEDEARALLGHVSDKTYPIVATALYTGMRAGEIYGLGILAGNIEDEPDNTTRFLVIGKQDAQPSGHDKTSLLLACHNEAGGLHALLTPFSEHGISMTRIESRPSRTSLWEYVFFVDIEGHRENPKVAAAFKILEKETKLFRILGSYPVSVL